ncbi:MAG TPA: hypothetical protein VFX16_12180 [Pseudonocardiaceae bacterium]|nr:hypothetical protein [Pseudonocardiaceae bacterium]
MDLEYSLALVVALIVGVLALTGIIQSIQQLVATTLSVLSLMAFSTLRNSQRRRLEAAKIDVLDKNVSGLSADLRSARTLLEATQAVMEIPGGLARDEAFNAALANPSVWHFRGCTGSYLRAETMRSVANSARKRAPSRSRITIQILNPTNEQVCAEYAAYRSALAEQRQAGTGDKWTTQQVRLECTACIIAAIWYSQHENLDIEMSLLDQMSTLRYDASDEIILVTNENSHLPALAVTRSSRLYHAIIGDLEFSLKRSTAIPLNRVATLPRVWTKISAPQLTEAMSRMGLRLDIASSDRPQLLELAFRGENKYRLS